MRFFVLLLMLAAVACKRPGPSPNLVVDPGLATLIPNDTVTLAGVELESLKKTAWYTRYVEGRKLPWLEDFIQQTGLDPRRDIWEFLLCSNRKDIVVMARGKFSQQGLEPRLERSGAQRFSYKGYLLLGTEQAAVTFMNSTVAVAGRADAVRRVIDQRNDQNEGPIKPLLAKAAAFPNTIQVWAVTVDNALPLQNRFPDTGNLANFNRFGETLQHYRVGADLRNGLKLEAQAVCTSEPDARRLHDALRGMIGLARLSTPDNQRDLLPVYDRVNVSQQDKTVLANVELPMELIEKLDSLLTALPGLRRRD